MYYINLIIYGLCKQRIEKIKQPLINWNNCCQNVKYKMKMLEWIK